jgi:hypothetical protein
MENSMQTQPIGLNSPQLFPDSECSSVEKRFFKNLQKSIEAENFSEAIGELFFLLVTPAKIPNFQTLYRDLFILFPYLTLDDFEKLKVSLPRLLEFSSHCVREQFQLAIELGHRQTLISRPENPFPSCCQAMDYFAKARQIAEKLKDPLLIQESYQSAAHVLLKSALDTESFKVRLSHARSRNQKDAFGYILSQIEHLKSFCCEEKDKEKIEAFYRQARQIFVGIPIGQQDSYADYANKVHPAQAIFTMPLSFTPTALIAKEPDYG